MLSGGQRIGVVCPYIAIVAVFVAKAARSYPVGFLFRPIFFRRFDVLQVVELGTAGIFRVENVERGSDLVLSS